MSMTNFNLLDFLVLLLTFLCLLSDLTFGYYVNQWAVHVKGGLREADLLARKHNFINIGQIGNLDDHYLFYHPKVLKRSIRQSFHHTRLKREKQVLWIEQQYAKRRVKRDIKKKYNPHFSDPLFKNQWYLNGGAKGGFDMNVAEAWSWGYTGKGVTVTILDDGLEKTHEDIKPNYDPEASYDFNDRDDDPSPRYDRTDENRHGTRCAGEVAAAANNSKCGVGIASKAGIGGVRMLDGDVTDAVEAMSLGLRPDHIDIYSASWGPDDNGKVVDGPALLAKKAFINGVTRGRKNLGSIFMWASGNGGNSGDSCNCDGYTNSIYTLSVSSVTENGGKPWYLEECSSTLASTYSSGGYGEKQIATTNLHNSCTLRHTGTSASAPLGAGIAALVLEANPVLTWRDMQYVTLLAARPEPIKDQGSHWVTNGVGRKVSIRYGYGLMDASKMVELAEMWTTVPKQHICISEKDTNQRNIKDKGLMVKVTMSGCPDSPNEIKYLEHVQAKITLRYSVRGAVSIHLTSPSGTHSTLLPPREKDVYTGEFNDWPFMSTHFWGEHANGTWKLEIENTGDLDNKGILKSWQLILYGTKEQPIKLKKKSVSRPNGKTTEISPKKGGTIPDEEKNHNKILEKEESSGGGYFSRWFGGGSKDKSGEKVQCHPECDGDCKGPKPEDCKKCKNYKQGLNGPCVHHCGDHEYGDDDHVCQKCHSACHTCNGPKSANCLTCALGYYYDEDASECVFKCKEGYFGDTKSQKCKECDNSCETCEDSADHCVTCKKGLEMHDHKCVDPCSDDEYRSATGSCERCHPDCATCKGSNGEQCLTCHHFYYHFNSTCVRHCPDGFYENDSGKQPTCSRCYASCSTCKGPEHNECTGCDEGLVLKGHICEPKPEGSGESAKLSKDKETNSEIQCKEGEVYQHGKCKSCHSNCQTCSGVSEYDCLSCTSPRFLIEGECVENCDKGFYKFSGSREETNVRECRKCSSMCKACSDRDQCTECPHGQRLEDGKCISGCPEGQYASSLGSCSNCDSSCVSCSGPGNDECTKCPSLRYFLEGRCVDRCPDHYYGMLTDSTCHKCHHSCSSCTGSSSVECTMCAEGFYYTGGVCHTTPHCSEEKYFDEIIEKCVTCDETCASCNGVGSYRCLTCHPPRKLSHHACVLCCTGDITEECCNCDEKGMCIRNTTEEETNETTMNTKNLTKLGMENLEETANQVDSDNTLLRRGSHGYYRTNAQPVAEGANSKHNPVTLVNTGLIITIAISCIMLFSLFFVIFGALQARSNKKWCWKHKYQSVPIHYETNNKIHFNGKSILTETDFMSEDEIF